MENYPRTGRVNEVCQEWMVREDGALAHRLQNQEFDDHLSGNKHRNALVREDFPKAKDEQIREQRMAEQAAAIYQKMLAEQEEIDNRVAKDLADKIEHEERMKRRAAELNDQEVARQFLEKERMRVERLHRMPSPQKPLQLPPKMDNQNSPHRPNPQNYQANLPRRQALAMPLPNQGNPNVPQSHFDDISSAELYNEPYVPAMNLSDQLNRIELAEIGVPIDEITERQIQEEKDAELARKLQAQEGSLEETLLNRDRMLAIEAQDKELAKMLQERERTKARRARERAKQKAQAKKQQQIDSERDVNQLMPDDSYAFPADVLSRHGANITSPDLYAVPNPDEDVSYSLPADVLPNSVSHNFKQNYSPNKFDNYGGELKEINGVTSNSPSLERSVGGGGPPIRPTHLDLRVAMQKKCERIIPSSKYERDAPEIYEWWLQLFDQLEKKARIKPDKRLSTLKEVIPIRILNRVLDVLNVDGKDESVDGSHGGGDGDKPLPRAKSDCTNISMFDSDLLEKSSDSSFRRKLGLAPEVAPNPYLDFFKRPLDRAAVWRRLPPLALEQMGLQQLADTVTLNIAEDFVKWLSAIGGDQETTVNVQSIIEMFEIGSQISSATTLRVQLQEMASVPQKVAEVRGFPGRSTRSVLHREIARDRRASRRPPKVVAFGTRLPPDMQKVPPQKDVYEKWLGCDKVPEKLETMAAVWQGITHLRSTRTFCQFLFETHPEIEPPKFLIDCGLMDGKALRSPKSLLRTDDLDSHSPSHAA